MKKILITGASGFLGAHLVNEFLKSPEIKVIAICGRPEDKANALPQSDNITVCPCSDLLTTDFGHVDTLIHTAFSRGDNLQGLTASIEMTENVIELVNNQDIDSMINISTQGLYQGLTPGVRVTEEGTVGPNTAYGLAKWAVENMLKLGCKKSYTNIRMASLSSNARFLDFFVDCVIAHDDITITAPNQYASIMDVTDAVSGIVSVVNLPLNQRSSVYNLGPGVQYSILEYAQAANEVGKTFGFAPTGIVIDDSGKGLAICMDCTRLMRDTGWKTIVHKDEMIENMFKKKKIENGC